MAFSKLKRRSRIRRRIRASVKGTASKPRLSVFRSNKFIYAQLINDVDGITIASASSKSKDFSASGNKVDQSKEVGKQLAEKAKAAGVETIIFDRGGYKFHGRVKSLADGAREAGLKF